jgi:hypothetical protein
MNAVVLSVFEKARAPAELAAHTLQIAQESHGRELLAHELWRGVVHQGAVRWHCGAVWRDAVRCGAVVKRPLPFSPDADIYRVLQLTEFLVEVCDGLPPDMLFTLQQFSLFYMWLHEYDWCHPHDLQVVDKLNLILGISE